MENLIGSEKQVEWANKIRAEKLNSLRTSITKTEVNESIEFLKGERGQFSRTNRFIDVEDVVSILMVEKNTQQIEHFLKNQTSASWWIDNRNVSTNDFVIKSEDEILSNRILRKELRKSTKEEILNWFLG
jgi:hypothetical protein